MDYPGRLDCVDATLDTHRVWLASGPVSWSQVWTPHTLIADSCGSVITDLSC